MIKSNLPVILLKNLVLLPLGEARIDLNNSLSKKIIELSKNKYDNKILVVTPINHLEEKPDTSDLPNLGVEATIKSKIDLPSGNTRIVLSGIKRVKVLKYSYYKSDNNILISEIISFPATTYNETLEVALTRKLIEVIKKYIDVDEKEIDVHLTNKANEDGTVGAPALYANIPIVTIKNEARKLNVPKQQEENNNEKEKSKETENEPEKQKVKDEKVEETVEVKEENEVDSTQEESKETENTTNTEENKGEENKEQKVEDNISEQEDKETETSNN